jgi:hypothetical protein
MPGNAGIRPDHNSFSVPVLMPLHSTSTTKSSSPGGESSTRVSAMRSGASSTTASVFSPDLLMWQEPLLDLMSVYADCAECQVRGTLGLLRTLRTALAADARDQDPSLQRHPCWHLLRRFESCRSQ